MENSVAGSADFKISVSYINCSSINIVNKTAILRTIPATVNKFGHMNIVLCKV